MAASNTTKKVFADSLRELMQEEPFEKITVSQICENRELSRKSFYYHFLDKYELVTWIFDNDFVMLVKKKHPLTTWEFLDMLCGYLYENRDFYRKVLQIQGQNSFSEHFEEFLVPLIRNRLGVLFGGEEVPEIGIDFLTDGFVSSIRRWLVASKPIPPEEFVATLRNLVEKTVANYKEED
ncbi:MAG: TetR/AcrR family transcriptional regulator C-terminal domain-containing protein [Lachnospiraceae bacterium]|nr:TetR/AcrR family transcriptional regulator C-terminal domain-containing protein [Lachnospiraceae bacterium]